MFTQNYINHRWNCFFGLYGSGNFIPNTGIYGKNYVATTGATTSGYKGFEIHQADIGRAMANPVISATFGEGIFFGTGPTPATVNDHTLESVIGSGIEIIYSTVSVGKEVDGRYSVCGQYTLRNTSGEPINIYEIGCFAKIYSSSSSSKPVLMERTVLPEPITIGWGEVKLVTYKLTFNQTLNVEE